MTLVPLRLLPGEDLKQALEAHARDHGMEAAFVVAAVGSLDRVMLRYAGAAAALTREACFELLTLSGSLSPDGAHLHASVADQAGHVFGGHVKEGCRVRTTMEILLAPVPGYRFSRRPDPRTGYAELNITPIEEEKKK